MNSKAKRHQNDTKSFEELNYKEQALSINMHAVWFVAATKNHIRKCAEAKGNRAASEMPAKVAAQLRRIADQVETLPTPKPTEVNSFEIVKISPRAFGAARASVSFILGYFSQRLAHPREPLGEA
jgi:hypothetical protein